MHKRKLKRNTLAQSIKTPENLSRSRDHQEEQSESSDHFQLPSLQKRKTWKDVDDNVQTWDKNSIAMDVFSPSEIENAATRKVMQQWEAVENTLYEDGEQVTQTAVLDECVQWRTQIPHLRIIGKSPFNSSISNQEVNVNHNQMRNSFSSHNEDAFTDLNISSKERKNSSKQKLQKSPRDEIINMLYEYVISELFPSKINDIDSLNNDFNSALQIRAAPIHSNKNSAKSTKMSWFEETIPLETRLSNSNNKALEDLNLPIRRETAQIHASDIHKLKNEKDESALEDKLFRPHTSRNKLGTVFNEKIVVSPVPYVLSTRESFTTVRTTPIKFMTQSPEISTFQGSSRNISYLRNSAKNSAKTNYQSAWHAPVSPAVWPKNIKLAPLDTSRLPSSKNRSVTSSSVALSRNRKPLSPISRPILPASAQINHSSNNEGLEIRGRQITPGQSPKLNATLTGNSKRKRSQPKIKS
ncbi:uncharacterized protein LOC108630556 isoform X2 [Ceratina calcarata]|uniref:Uncharacterized protein LOC108630556 isoform X2 n=1 Tax=Ceratina calcarata TaxID=156304 RepID=A0AAJ7ND56_9HYME|nr:uncharacterized protein LOC108630556 isoform X2 [Ceratina calcarata]